MESPMNMPEKTNWLQRLKEESWEAELLVSTVSIFGTFQMLGLVDWAIIRFIDVLNPTQYTIGYFITIFGLMGIGILIGMFVIHFFLRAYWIGLVGLNSVFPDYSIEHSAFSKIYTEKVLSILPKLKDSIQKVDELCSVIFSVAFAFLLGYSWMAICASLLLWLYNSLSEIVPSDILLIPLYLIAILFIAQFVLSIIANLKPFKEHQKIQTLYFKMVQYVSMLAYGPFYKSIFQVSMIFGSNYKKKKHLVYLMFLFVFFGMLVLGYKAGNSKIVYLIDRASYFEKTISYPEYYKSESTNTEFLLSPQIDSDRIETSVFKLFIPIFKNEKNMRNHVCSSIISDEEMHSENRGKIKGQILECYRHYNTVYINGAREEVDFIRAEHPDSKQFGIMSYIDVSDLSTGWKEIFVKKELGEEFSSEWTIPFYYVAQVK